MLKIEGFALGALQTNAYLLSKPEEKRAVIIDPGMNPQPLLKRIADLHIEAILLTHAHFDHIGGVDEIRKLKNCPVYIHDAEAEWLTSAKLNGSLRWSDVTPPIETDPAEYALDEGQKLQLLGETFHVLHTPGHSPGSVSFLWESSSADGAGSIDGGGSLRVVFGGDVLFRLSVGRTDLPGGSERVLRDSILTRLYPLPDDTIVYPGHGPKTTIGFEKVGNPYVQG